jgi:hypothetical protein
MAARTMIAAAAALLLALCVHIDAESCGCKAFEVGFVINCNQAALLQDAAAALVANNCNINCDSSICATMFSVVQVRAHCRVFDPPFSLALTNPDDAPNSLG